MRIASDTAATGKIHKYEHIFILAQGELSMTTGNEVVRVRAPYVAVSSAGTKRAIYTYTDCTVITIHRANETDLAKIDEQFIASDEAK